LARLALKPVPSSLLVQKLSSKEISGSDIMKLKVSHCEIINGLNVTDMYVQMRADKVSQLLASLPAQESHWSDHMTILNCV